MAHIDLDVTYDEATEKIDDAVHALVGGYGVDWQVTEPVSSSGGWPIVRFSGARSTLEQLLNAYGIDPLDVDFWHAQIVD